MIVMIDGDWRDDFHPLTPAQQRWCAPEQGNYDCPRYRCGPLITKTLMPTNPHTFKTACSGRFCYHFPPYILQFTPTMGANCKIYCER